ncbi:Hsp33 family molecular chaperone [Pseudohoeflea coraliihabitans]|uniref:Hsp33 family molecular chaperone n=1 Tax=Pseudohoeflea coraliihabitans TaxID=2860393 RepID=A0ABS6WNE7_9HYPH|nr:Hsp33 family molecular chaperone [Pseudohoeflea sp. DP4N28-3]MBW3097489.1 Hsp33 family molecular chaperone [Pseudohoeflea sp. DP4N28-3]
MTDSNLSLGDIGFAGDDNVVPFEVAGLDVRGRAVQLGPMLDTILGRHDYPEPVARLLAELITLTVLLGTSLKFEGKLIAQTKGDGPIDFVVADFSTPGDMRAYARYDEARLEAAIAEGHTSPAQLLGSGILAFTIDQGAYMQRYQGIVEMTGGSLAEMAETYFRQSEQIPTLLRMAVGELFTPDADGKTRRRWRAGGMVVQFLPSAPERMRQNDLPGGDVPEGVSVPTRPDDDAWAEARALVETIEADELADPEVGSERLLYRLFNEHGVRVFPPTAVADRCSCSRDKLAEVLQNFSAEEIRDSTEDGRISVVCEFCSTAYDFDPAEFSNSR